MDAYNIEVLHDPHGELERNGLYPELAFAWRPTSHYDETMPHECTPGRGARFEDEEE
jgi:hypothetical protein